MRRKGHPLRWPCSGAFLFSCQRLHSEPPITIACSFASRVTLWKSLLGCSGRIKGDWFRATLELVHFPRPHSTRRRTVRLVSGSYATPFSNSNDLLNCSIKAARVDAETRAPHVESAHGRKAFPDLQQSLCPISVGRRCRYQQMRLFMNLRRNRSPANNVSL